MHWGLKAAVLFATLAFLVHAGFTQFYETGVARVLAPTMMLGVVALYLAFLWRRPWTWRLVLWWCVVVIVINLAFLPEQRDFGDFVAIARVLVGFEITASALILAFMLHPAARGNFHGGAS